MNPRFLTASEALPIIYVSFRFNIHSDQEFFASLIQIGSEDFNQGIIASFSSPGFAISGAGSDPVPDITLNDEISLGEWHSAEMSIAFIGPSLFVAELAIDGSQIDPTCNQHIPQSFGHGEITHLRYGAWDISEEANHHLSDLKIGTSGFGSSNIFQFTDSAISNQLIVPPFDSITGEGLSVDAAGLLVESASEDVYAVKSITIS